MSGGGVGWEMKEGEEGKEGGGMGGGKGYLCYRP